MFLVSTFARKVFNVPTFYGIMSISQKKNWQIFKDFCVSKFVQAIPKVPLTYVNQGDNSKPKQCLEPSLVSQVLIGLLIFLFMDLFSNLYFDKHFDEKKNEKKYQIFLFQSSIFPYKLKYQRFYLSQSFEWFEIFWKSIWLVIPSIFLPI